ncbi:hypothetical protein QQF64_002074 [Cirrhinus molitorella]|uniref:HMG box domain-containing protein n=2 Tax=Cirrhinus molitorella TaxID=172907 RepID=A0ABR3MP38_9TELE
MCLSGDAPVLRSRRELQLLSYETIEGYMGINFPSGSLGDKTVNILAKMGKDPTKPRGKMSSYAYFVQTCREEHKKKHPEATVNFSEFSKKCSERWKTMSAKEKGKFEDMAKQDKARYEREMKNYIPPKGEKKKRFKDPNAPKRPPSAFFIFCSEFRPKVKEETPGLSIGDVAKKLGEMWNKTSAEEKQPYEKKAAKLKEKYEKDIAAYRSKGKVGGGAAKAPSKPDKANDDDDEDDDEDEDEDDEEEEDDDESNIIIISKSPYQIQTPPTTHAFIHQSVSVFSRPWQHQWVTDCGPVERKRASHKGLMAISLPLSNQHP